MNGYDDLPYGVEPEHFDRVNERLEALRVDRDARRALAVEEAGGKAPLRILNRGDLGKLPRPAPAWDGWLYAGQPALISAPGGVGKSALLLGLAVATWHGLPLLGGATRRGRTLYMTREGQGALNDRIEAWERHMGLEVGSTEIDAIVDRQLDPDTLAQVTDFVRERQHVLCIADTFSSVTSVKSENDNAEISILLRAWHEAILNANPSAVPVLAHHVTETVDKSGRRSQKSRGASAFRDDHATVILLEGTADALSMSTEYARAGKQKDAAPRTLAGLVLRQVDPSVVVAQATEQEAVSHLDRVRRLVDLMLPGADYPSAALMALWGLKSRDNYQALRTEAIKAGLIVKGPSNKDPYRRADSDPDSFGLFPPGALSQD